MGRPEENEQGQLRYRMGEYKWIDPLTFVTISCDFISDDILQFPGYLLGQLHLGVLCVTEPP